MNELLSIRPAHEGDLPFLVDCNAAMAWETEEKTLDRELLARGTRAVFADPARGFYRIAERQGRPLGCLLVTREWSDWRNGNWWWIQSVYVIADARRSGVFRALYADLESDARSSEDVVGLRLYVEKENRAAQATYAALGLSDSGYLLLQSEFAGLDWSA